MPRIVAGEVGGRHLSAPPGPSTRPTSQRAREGLFGTLGSLVGNLAGLRFADFYAGTGAVGFEALSRGAAHALLVESSRPSVRVIEANARSLGLAGAVVVARPAERVATGPPPDARPYDIVFLDPPYGLAAGVLAGVVADLRESRWFAAGAVVVVERDARDSFCWPDGIARERERRYGDAMLWYGRSR